MVLILAAHGAIEEGGYPAQAAHEGGAAPSWPMRPFPVQPLASFTVVELALPEPVPADWHVPCRHRVLGCLSSGEDGGIIGKRAIYGAASSGNRKTMG